MKKSVMLCAFSLSTLLMSGGVFASDCVMNLEEIKNTFVKHANEVANSPVKVTLEDVWAPGSLTTKSGDTVVIIQAEVKTEKEPTTYLMTGLLECDAEVQKFDVHYYTLTSVKAPPQEKCEPVPAPAPAPAPGDGNPPTPPPADGGGSSR